MANNETRVSKTNTFEEFRQKSNEVSLHLGANDQMNSSITDKVFNYNNVAAGTIFFSDSDDNSKAPVFNITVEQTLDNTGGYIILTGSPSIAGFAAGGIVTQAGGYTATIVSVSTDKILVKHSSGTFSSSVNLNSGGASISSANIARIVAEAYPIGLVRVYVNNTEINQDLNAGGFHVANYHASIPLLNSPSITGFSEGATVYQGASLAAATFSGTVLYSTSTILKLKIYTGAFNGNTQIKVDGSSDTISGANHGDITHIENTFGNAIELNTPATLNDDIRIFGPTAIDAINELQDDVGITENLTTVATNLTNAVNEIEAVFDASTHEISAGSTAFNVTSGEFTIDSSADIVLDADGGNVELKDAGVQYGSLTNTSGNLIVKSGTTTMLTGTAADGTFANDLTITRDVDVDRNLNVDGNSTFIGNVTVTGITDVGQLNTLFSNRNNVKLALNELHTEMGSAIITGTDTPAAGLSNLTAGLNAIDAEIGATAYLAGTGLDSTITFAVDAIQDYIGTYTSGTPDANTVSSTLTGALNQLHTEIGSSSLDDNLPTDYTYTVTDHTTAINTMSGFIGDTSIANIGTTDTVTGALQKLHAEIGDSVLTVFSAANRNISGALRELELEKVYLDSSSVQTITSQLDIRGDLAFTDGGASADRMTFGTGTTLDLTDATLLLPGTGGATFSYPFLFVDGDVAVQGYGVDRAHVTMADKTTAKIQWSETVAGTNPSHSWQLVGLDDNSDANTAGIVTFYNAQDLIKTNTESGIVVDWDDTTQTFDFDVNDPTISFTGDVAGSGILTDLGDLSIALTVQPDSVALTTDTTGDYVKTVTGTANQITVSGTGTEGRDATFSIPIDFRAPGTVQVLGSTASGSSSTGALTVAGGVGIGEDLYVAGDLYVQGARTELNVATLEVEDSIIITNSLNQSVGEFGLKVNDANGNIAHTFVYNYSAGRWEADGSLLVSEATIGAPSIEGNTLGIGSNLAYDNNGSSTGISVATTISGTTINTAFANTDKGSSQLFYKTFTADTSNTAASANNDSIAISGGLSIATVASADTITINHDATGPADQNAVSSNNSGNTFIQDIAFDGQGHVSGISTGTVSINNGTITVAGGTDIDMAAGNSFTLNGTGTTLTVNHATINTASDVTAASNTFIDEITISDQGHVTGVGTGTVDLSSKDNYGSWTLSDGTNSSDIGSGDTATFSAGAGITVGEDAGTITITNSYGNITNNNQLTNGAGYLISSGTIANATYATSAGSAGSVAWTNVTGKPTIPAAANNGQINGSTSGAGLSGSMSATANQSGNTTFTVSSNATTAASGSTIAYRDASGHLFANHINTTSSVATSIQYLSGMQSNNYQYKYSAASVRSFLSVPTINATTGRYAGGEGGWRRLTAFTHNYNLGYYNTGTYTRDFTVKIGTTNESYSPDSFIVSTRLADYYWNYNFGGQDQMRYTISEKRYNMIRVGYTGTNSQSAGKYLSWRSQITKVGTSNSWPRSLAIEVWATSNGIATVPGSDTGTFQGNFLM